MKLRILGALLLTGSIIARTEIPHKKSKIEKVYNATKKHIISVKEWLNKNKIVKYGIIGLIMAAATIRSLYSVKKMIEEYNTNDLIRRLNENYLLKNYSSQEKEKNVSFHSKLKLSNEEKEKLDMLSQKYIKSDKQNEYEAFVEYYIQTLKMVCSKNKEKEPEIISSLLAENQRIENNFNICVDTSKISDEMKNNLRLHFINEHSDENQFLRDLQKLKILPKSAADLLAMFITHRTYKKMIQALTQKE